MHGCAGSFNVTDVCGATRPQAHQARQWCRSAPLITRIRTGIRVHLAPAANPPGLGRQANPQGRHPAVAGSADRGSIDAASLQPKPTGLGDGTPDGATRATAAAPPGQRRRQPTPTRQEAAPTPATMDNKKSRKVSMPHHQRCRQEAARSNDQQLLSVGTRYASR